MSTKSEIQDVVHRFVERLSSLIEDGAAVRARDAILNALDGHAGGPRVKGVIQMAAGKAGRKRRKGPIQLCPVPGCANRAAPVFGMVCAKHKDLSKAEIRKYREQRRAQKAKGKN